MVTADRRRWTAVIVEDDPGQRALGAMMLSELDMAVVQAASADEAIDRLRDRSGEVAVVIADVNLSGGLDGVDLAHRVSVLWPTISVIVTSGEPPDRIGPLPARATFVPKPWTLDMVALAEAARRQDHSVHAVRL